MGYRLIVEACAIVVGVIEVSDEFWFASWPCTHCVVGRSRDRALDTSGVYPGQSTCFQSEEFLSLASQNSFARCKA